MDESQNWHFETFIKGKPKPVTLVGQLLKIKEESYEWKVSKDLEELADIMIAIAGLRNLDRQLADIFEITVLSMIDVDLDELGKAILAKLVINRQRTWQEINGVWHH